MKNCIGQWQLGLVIVSAALLSSCSHAPDWLLPGKNKVASIELTPSLDMNNSMALAIDGVFVFDAATADVLSLLSAREWFDGKTQLRTRYAENILVIEKQLVPDTQVETITLPDNSERAVAILVFANYSSSGIHRVEITDKKEASLIFNSQRFMLKE